MPHHSEIVRFLASVLRLNNIFKLLLVLVRRGKQAVLTFIRRFLIVLSHRGPPIPPEKAATAPVHGACSHDSGLQSAAYPPRPAGSPVAQPNQSLTPSSVSLQSSTAVMNSGVPQNPLPNDKPPRNLNLDMVPLSPEELGERRNKTHGQIERTDADDIPPLKVEFTVPAVETGWKRCIHPEGAIYYQNEVGVRSSLQSTTVNKHSQGVLTRCDLRNDQELHHRIMLYSRYLYDQLWQYPDPPQFHHLELVLDIVPKSQDAEDCQYYFVDHSRRVVFWLCEYKPSRIYCYVKGVQAEDHIGLAIETQYWQHCELFPHISLDAAVCQPLRETLIHSLSEAILSESALAPYTATELQQMLDLTSNIVDSASKDSTIQGPSLYVIARMMHIFTRMKFINFHGQMGARLNADQSIYVKDERNDTEHTSRLFHIVNIILLSAPRDQFDNLRHMWVDNIIHLPRWNTFVTTQTTELTGFTTYSTVMLAVNVSFLAVPGVASQTQTATPMMILVRQSRGQSSQTADEAAAYMLESAPSKTHMEWLAIVYSLPVSLIMWGMIAFVVALCITVFSLNGTGMHASMSFCFALVAGMGLSPVLWRLYRRRATVDRRPRDRLLSWLRSYP